MAEPICPVCGSPYSFSWADPHAFSHTSDGRPELVIETTYEPCGHRDKQVIER